MTTAVFFIRTLLTLSIITGLQWSCFGQETFFKEMDLSGHFTDNIDEILVKGDSLYLLVRHVDTTHRYCSVVNFNLGSKTYDVKFFPWRASGKESLKMKADNRIILIGANENGGTEDTFFVEDFSIVDDQINSYAIPFILNSSQLNPVNLNQYFNNYIVTGQYWLNGEPYAMICWFDSTFRLDTVLVLDDLDERINVVSKSAVDSDGNLLVNYYVNLFTQNQYGFMKFNKDKEMIWDFRLPRSRNDGLLFYFDFELLDDNSIVFVNQSDEDAREHAIHRISALGDSIWKFNYIEPASTSLDISILDITVARDGNILACGQKHHVDIFAPFNVVGGYVAKFDVETGEMIWEQTIATSIDDGFYDTKYCVFNTVEELSDGRLALGGFIDNEWAGHRDRDAWLVVTDSMGCLTATCDSVQDISSSIEIAILPDGPSVKISPNPVLDQFRLSTQKTLHEDISFSVYNSHGQCFMTDIWPKSTEVIEVNVQNLIPGIYFIVLLSGTAQTGLSFVKI